MKETLKKVLKSVEAFDELKYDSTEPFSIFLIGLLHLESFQGTLKYDNAEFDVAELESKM